MAVVVCMGVFLQPDTALAYVTNGKKWPTTSVKYILSASLTSTEKSIVSSAAAVWNADAAAWTLSSTTSSGVYNIWSKTSFSSQGMGSIPGITETTTSGTSITKCRSWFNTDYSWNASGVMNQSTGACDYKTVILHEFGHWIYLGHDSAHPTAVMWPNWTKKQALTTDDRNGLNAVY